MREKDYWWGFTTGEELFEVSKEEGAALVAAGAFCPTVKISDRHTGRYRWTGPETLWLATPEDPSPKK
ncbi:MAG: hypothetical protein ACYDH3_13230 [Candidatus Aminicenantales bacterium]